MVKKKSNNQSSSLKKASHFLNNKNNSIRKQVISIYSIFSIVILLSIYLLSPLSNLDTLSVEGNNEVDDQKITDVSKLQNGAPLWDTYFDNRIVEERIVNNIPQVEGAQLNFSGIDDFTIKIDEYNTVAYLNREGTYHKVLENGEVLQDNTESTGEVPVLINFDDEDTLSQIVKQITQLDSTIADMISKIEKVDVERNPLLVRTYMKDGSQVLASIPTYAERITMFPQLKEAVNGQKGLFDLEAGAYFTPFADPNESNINNENIVEDRVGNNESENDSISSNSGSEEQGNSQENSNSTNNGTENHENSQESSNESN